MDFYRNLQFYSRDCRDSKFTATSLSRSGATRFLQSHCTHLLPSRHLANLSHLSHAALACVSLKMVQLALLPRISTFRRECKKFMCSTQYGKAGRMRRHKKGVGCVKRLYKHVTELVIQCPLSGWLHVGECLVISPDNDSLGVLTQKQNTYL